MISLNRPKKPDYLHNNEQQLTEKYHSDGSSVWNIERIKTPLLESSYNKCAYCECSLQVTGTYMEVEHYLPKKLYPHKVVDWDNLLPSCKRCNVKKGNFDTEKNPIVNPYEKNPKDHLTIQAFRLYSKTEMGKTTIDLLNLNDHSKLCLPRFTLCNKINDDLKYIREYKDLTEMRNKLNGLLISCSKSGEFSAFCSHTLHSNEDYYEIKNLLISNDYWDDELEQLDQETSSIALDSR